MGLYESNFIRLGWLAGDLGTLRGEYCSRVPSDCDLVLSVTERSPAAFAAAAQRAIAAGYRAIKLAPFDGVIAEDAATTAIDARIRAPLYARPRHDRDRVRAHEGRRLSDGPGRFGDVRQRSTAGRPAAETTNDAAMSRTTHLVSLEIISAPLQ